MGDNSDLVGAVAKFNNAKRLRNANLKKRLGEPCEIISVTSGRCRVQFFGERWVDNATFEVRLDHLSGLTE